MKEKKNSKGKKLRKEIKNSKKIEMSFQIVAISYAPEVPSQKKYGEDSRNGFWIVTRRTVSVRKDDIEFM